MGDPSPITALVKKLLACAPFWPSASRLPPAVDLEALRRMVARIEAVVSDAEERDIQDESVKFWLRDLRDAAYEADDVLDEYEYELLGARAEVEIQGGQAATVGRPRKQTRREVRRAMTTNPCLDASFWSRAAGVIQKIQGKLEEISKRREGLHLGSEGDGRRRYRNSMVRLPAGVLVDVRNLFGREDELGKVIGLLFSEECTRSDLFVIPIVGIGGVGKTTLAQLVYNHSQVCNIFQLRGWVSVSDDFELVQLTRRIYEVFTTAGENLKELSMLQKKLMDEIKGKRFLLILDDVWSEDPDLCDGLLLPLKHGKQGSAIIVTTRSQTVAAIMAPAHHHHHRLDCLSEEDCWKVFRQNAFRDQDAQDHHHNYPELVDIGKYIARKCRGLPLAAKSLGRLLCHCGYDVESWRDVLESNVWDVDDKIIPALMLSYVHLPRHLKQCFLYASIFPKDYRFKKAQLVMLWLAQGYIQQTRNREFEAIGGNYFDELVNRSFFQSNPDDPSLFTMHDLNHDLAQYIWHGEHVVMDMRKAGHQRVPETRHLTLQGCIDSTSVADLHCLAPEAVRTVVRLTPIYGRFHVEWGLITTKLLNLRVLHLTGGGLFWLPEAIGNLKHLRYLNLANNSISILPATVWKLYHLQTLILSNNILEPLPTGIANLANLRCLKVGRGTLLPRGIGGLTSLRSLDVFNVGEVGEDCAGVEELKDLMQLRGSLTIENLRHMVDAGMANEADLKGKTMLSSLQLVWDSDRVVEFISQDQQEEVLQNLRPHGGLKHLKINEYGGVLFPEWLGDPCFSNLAVVEISGTASVALPSLGRLPSLRRLKIWSAYMVQLVGAEFRGPGAVFGFPALEELVFEEMLAWVEWGGVQCGDFPRLRRLELVDCHRLGQMVPLYHLSALEGLFLRRCGELAGIQLWSPSSSSSDAALSSVPPMKRPVLPPLKQMVIENCPHARFSPADDEQLLELPPTLHHLQINSDCPLLMEWCQTDAGFRSLSRIPGAEMTEDWEGRLFVCTYGLHRPRSDTGFIGFDVLDATSEFNDPF